MSIARPVGARNAAGRFDSSIGSGRLADFRQRCNQLSDRVVGDAGLAVELSRVEPAGIYQA
jgi:hypothetical protein